MAAYLPSPYRHVCLLVRSQPNTCRQVSRPLFLFRRMFVLNTSLARLARCSSSPSSHGRTSSIVSPSSVWKPASLTLFTGCVGSWSLRTFIVAFSSRSPQSVFLVSSLQPTFSMSYLITIVQTVSLASFFRVVFHCASSNYSSFVIYVSIPPPSLLLFPGYLT